MGRPPRPSGAQKLPPAEKVTVRMYRMGFGDCFVLFVPSEGGQRKVLIDCGSIKRDPNLNKGASDVAEQVVKDLTVGGKARIDLLIATHRHKDHVGGFADAVWDTVEVGEVWLPWTESEADPEAQRLRAMQQRVAETLTERLKARAKPELAELARNATSNDEALDMLRTGFKSRERKKPRYLGAGETDPKIITTPQLPGVNIHVLGPPRDVSVINRDLPRDEEELFLRLGAAGAEPPKGGPLRPFGDEWVDEYRSVLPQDRIDALEKAAAFDPEELLSAIEDSLNNTSLVLVFEIGGRHLMFPGDAQWGPWDTIMHDADAVELLRKVSFYKVSHHSSHNGTPRHFVNDLLGKDTSSQLVAMVSVTAHGSYRDIPRQPLMDALKDRFDRIAVSDTGGNQAGFVRSTKWSIDFEYAPAPTC